jgi:hypothetical protein
MTITAFKDITANVDVYENRHYLWDTLSTLIQMLFTTITAEWDSSLVNFSERLENVKKNNILIIKIGILMEKSTKCSNFNRF